MTFGAAMADVPSRRSSGRASSGRVKSVSKSVFKSVLKIVLFSLAATGSSLMIAAWITGSDLSTLASAALPANTDQASFEDRFLVAPKSARLQPMQRVVLASAESAILPAQNPLAQQRWASEGFRAGIADDEPNVLKPDELKADETKPASTGIPMPRSRPVVADLATQPASALALADPGRPPDRSLLEKFSDLVSGRTTLASLPPGEGLFHKGPDLAAYGYDRMTAVYDITAREVYLPNGSVLEAHSGMGDLRDDPNHVSVHNAGATPPAVYSLKLREKDFHGVQAIRMTPAEGSDIGGRAGLLVHSFMLGPDGDSNGCISVKDYDRFLKAFNDGEFNRIAVVSGLKGQLVAARNPT